MRDFHKPVRRPGEILEALVGGGDPADSLAHDCAAALLHRVHAADDPSLPQRIVDYANRHGIDDVAELWAEKDSATLPGALWRIYLIRHVVASEPERAGFLFREGLATSTKEEITAAGTTQLPLPEEVLALANEIFKGAFAGDFAVALERAAAFSRILAAGAIKPGPDEDLSLGACYTAYANDLAFAAKLERAGKLA